MTDWQQNAIEGEPEAWLGRDDGARFCGLLQFSCALRPPNFAPPGRRNDGRFDPLTEDDLCEIAKAIKAESAPGLGGRLIPQRDAGQPADDSDNTWRIAPLYSDGIGTPRADASDTQTVDHTWLRAMSRHRAVPLPREFYDSDAALPPELSWPKPYRNPKDAAWVSAVRVQRAMVDRAKPSNRSDVNDYLISSWPTPCPRGMPLRHLQEFAAFMYAQRRSVIFASQFSERLYNVWLPPGLLRDPDSECSLAIIPFVSRVRMPFRKQFRATTAVSLVVVPVVASTTLDATAPRTTNADDLYNIVESLAGPSTHKPRRVLTSYRLDSQSPLAGYLQLLGHDAAGHPATSAMHAVACGTDGPTGTFRQWLELVTVGVAESYFEWADEVELAKRRVADETLRAIRLSGAWLVLAGTLDLAYYDSTKAYYQDDTWWPDNPAPTQPPRSQSVPGVPASVSALLNTFSSGVTNNRAVAAPSDRVDDLETARPESLTWAIPGLRAVVTVGSLRHEAFPGLSLLNSFGWIGQMVVSMAAARTIVQKLGDEARFSRTGDAAELARRSHLLLLELEEMYDLDVAWPTYARFYRRLRARLGLNDHYDRVREQVAMLAHEAEVISDDRQATGLARLQLVGFAAALGLIALTGAGAGWSGDRRLVEIVLAATVFVVAVASLWTIGWGAIPTGLGRMASGLGRRLSRPARRG